MVELILLRSKYNLTPAALDLVDQLLAYDPSKRISASEALDAPFFTSELPEKELLECVPL
jgi:serine/threonine protein kinase